MPRCLSRCTVLLLSLFAAPTLAAPPQVVSTTPANGDLAVDPSVDQLVIVFDQDMSPGGRSMTGGGDTFPKLIGQPVWRDPRTFVWRVKLEPDHEYRFGVNSPSYRNFKSAAGESSVPYFVHFRTAPDGEAASAAGSPEEKLTPEANDAAIAKLREAITQRYSYRDRLGIDWNALIDEYAPKMRAATTQRQFAASVLAILGQAKDKHISVRIGGETVPAFVNPVRVNANAQVLPKIVPGWTQLADGFYVGRYDDHIGYLRIDAWSRDTPVGAYITALQMLVQKDWAKAMVIDVRFNGGGDETMAAFIASQFVDHSVVYAQHVYADPDAPGGFTPVRQRTLDPIRFGDSKRFAGKVAVLVGPAVMSSCEAFVLMMKQDPDCKTFGDTTQGSSGNPRPHELGNGLAVILPSWKSMDPQGREFEGIGLEPDVKVSATERDFADADPVLDAAMQYLRQ
ncbi:MAG: hypothetical protein IT445_18540 [Phycisphaeraceae bacterium]|nr:hypothetical protein [Phycisphaeraceae bacterium]